MSLIIRSLAGKDLRAMTELFNYGFEDYVIPMQLTEDKVNGLITRENVVLDMSVEGLLDGKSVGFCWTGVRGDVAWCGGIGVGREHRGKGYGREMMTHCIELTRKYGMKRYTLECIKSNERALKMYEGLGLKVIGDLYNFKNMEPQPIDIDPEEYFILPGNELSLIKYWNALHQVPRSWQGDLPSILNSMDSLQVDLLVRGDEVAGMMVYGEHTNGLMVRDIAVKEENKKLAQICLAELHKKQKPTYYQFVPERATAASVLKEAGYESFIEQVQMSLEL